MEAYAFLQTQHRQAHNDIVASLIDLKMAMKSFWSTVDKLVNVEDHYKVINSCELALNNIVPESAAFYDVSLKDIVRSAASPDLVTVSYFEHFKHVWEDALDYSREGIYNGKPNDLKMLSTFDSIASSFERVVQNIRYFIGVIIPELVNLLIPMKKSAS